MNLIDSSSDRAAHAIRMISGIYLGVAGVLLLSSAVVLPYYWLARPGADAPSPSSAFATAFNVAALAGYVINAALCVVALAGAGALRRRREWGRRVLIAVSIAWMAGVIVFGALWIIGWTINCFALPDDSGGPAAVRALAAVGGALLCALFVAMLSVMLRFFIVTLRSLKNSPVFHAPAHS